jgi:hypothetical protein
MLRAIESGDGASLASASLGLTEPALRGAQALGLVSAETVAQVAPYLSIAGGLLGTGLGLYAHDPGSVISGVSGTVAGGMMASGALGLGGAALTGGLAAIPGIEMMVGGMRSADIERGYQKSARGQLEAFSADPNVRGARDALARYRAGDRRAADSLIQALGAAAVTSNRAAQPEGGGGIASRIQQIFAAPIWEALRANPADFQRAIDVVSQMIWGPANGLHSWFQGASGLALAGVGPPGATDAFPRTKNVPMGQGGGM